MLHHTVSQTKGEADHRPFMPDSGEFYSIYHMCTVPATVFDVDSETSKRGGEELGIFPQEGE